MHKPKSAAAVVLLIIATSRVGEANFIVNGGFEVGNFAGWTTNDPSLGTFVTSTIIGGTTSYSPHSGDYFAAMGASGLMGTIYQEVATTAGSSYTLSFFLASDGETPNEFAVTWAGSIIFDQANIVAQNYIQYTFHVTATSALSVLSFSEVNDNGFLSLDDVSLNSAAVAEPSSLLMLSLSSTSLVACVGISCLRRSRYRRPAVVHHPHA